MRRAKAMASSLASAISCGMNWWGRRVCHATIGWLKQAFARKGRKKKRLVKWPALLVMIADFSLQPNDHHSSLSWWSQSGWNHGNVQCSLLSTLVSSVRCTSVRCRDVFACFSVFVDSTLRKLVTALFFFFKMTSVWWKWITFFGYNIWCIVFETETSRICTAR